MLVFIGSGRCGNCLKNKKVVKLVETDARGFCRACLKELYESKLMK